MKKAIKSKVLAVIMLILPLSFTALGSDEEEVAIKQCDVAPAAFDEYLANTEGIDVATRDQAVAINNEIKAACEGGDEVMAAQKTTEFVVLLGIE
ncbi:hypothetical protein CMT41_11330 [Colwellia sp. MT41]|uniref:hypothetical protein n=1 Tax=Colwellia sp. MT41 TaxID=58049 RepID=UPI000717B72E|nr:hypothetical protein [Colwellia sp. MT41]ALO35244.1 hypothetical protein CMT41_11330 [Colwellia sp. MT41]